MSEETSDQYEVKILLVDDEVNITKALRRLLMEREGLEVLTANSGAQALEIIAEEQRVGVIISDQRMPEMTGVAFLNQARQLVPDAVRMLLTGYADLDASIASINKGGVFRYLTKPWDDSALLEAVDEAVRNYLLVAENKRLNALVLKQRDELQDWNTRLKQRVLDQTSQIRRKSDDLAVSNLHLRESFSATIESLAGLIEMRDRRAPGHSRNVAELVSAMAVRLKLPEQEQKEFRYAGLLHDIGKIGIADTLLRKTYAELDEQELQEYRDHAIRGQAAIDMVPELREIGVLIRHHHEHYDGKGFPDRLKGEAIPLGARVICAADMFERRLIQSQQPALLDDVLEALVPEWGTALDPALRQALEGAAQDVYRTLDAAVDVVEAKVAPKELAVGMRLQHDLYSGTGVLLLKKGTIFDESGIEAVKRCSMIDPFEREICVLMQHRHHGGLRK